MNVCIFIPTFNGGNLWEESAEKIHEAVKASKHHIKTVVIDSSSKDNSTITSTSFGFELITISPKEFSHSRTRNKILELDNESEYFVFLTQDSILSSPDSIDLLLNSFSDPSISAVCGRQVPHKNANPIAIHARKFNYPSVSCIKSFNDINSLGIKTAFMSNSFAAYRRDIFELLGGFPPNTILAEDMYLASRMILAGYKVAYCAEAAVRHSHNYSPWEEFRRYFDTGVFHACEPWIQENLGGASGEGMKFVKSELSYLLSNAPLWIPRSILTAACKLAGYKLGKNYKKLPKSWCKKFSMYTSYWGQQ